MRGFDGYLSPSLSQYSRVDVEVSSLYCAPTELGAACAIVGSSGLTKVPFLSGPTDPGPSYNVSGLVAGKIYDVWCVDVSGVATMGLLRWGRAYNTGNYGSGMYGGRQPSISDTQYFGVPVNPVPITLRMNNGSSLAVPQYKATFIGTVSTDAVDGKIKCHSSYKLSPKWMIWNRHNKRDIIVKGGSNPYELAGNISFSDRDWSPWLNSDALTGPAQILVGRSSPVSSRFSTGTYQVAPVDYASILQNAIGWNSKNSPSGIWGAASLESFCDSGQQGAKQFSCEFVQPSASGMNDIWPLVKIQGPVLPGATVDNGASYASLWGNELRGGLTVEYEG